MRLYEVRPRKDKRGFDLISDVLPFGRLWYAGEGAVGNHRIIDPSFARVRARHCPKLK
jgi:hypothetical protein